MRAPDPVACAEDEPYWQAARDGRLLLQRCKVTGRFQFPPRGRCMETGRHELEWVESPGTGVVHTCTVVERSFFENLAAPYVLAIVELDEGVRLTSHVIGIAPEQVDIGLRVRADFVQRDGILPLLIFRPCT